MKKQYYKVVVDSPGRRKGLWSCITLGSVIGLRYYKSKATRANKRMMDSEYGLCVFGELEAAIAFTRKEANCLSYSSKWQVWSCTCGRVWTPRECTRGSAWQFARDINMILADLRNPYYTMYHWPEGTLMTDTVRMKKCEWKYSDT